MEGHLEGRMAATAPHKVAEGGQVAHIGRHVGRRPPITGGRKGQVTSGGHHRRRCHEKHARIHRRREYVPEHRALKEGHRYWAGALEHRQHGEGHVPERLRVGKNEQNKKGNRHQQLPAQAGREATPPYNPQPREDAEQEDGHDVLARQREPRVVKGGLREDRLVQQRAGGG